MLQEEHADVIANVDDKDVLDTHEQFLIDADETVMRTRIMLRRLAAATLRPVRSEQPVQAEGRDRADLLPDRCKIAPFYGDFSKWQEFRDMFLAMVDSRPISNVQKLQYLKNSVKDSAANVLGNWQLSADNYYAAWQSLKDVYEDRYLIVKAHLNKLFGMPNVRDNYDGVRAVIDTTNEAVRSLKVLGVQVDHWDTILVYMVESRLNGNLKEAWDLRRIVDDGLPSLKDMLAFLSARARAKANHQYSTGAVATRRARISEQSSEYGPSKPSKSRVQEKCTLCRAEHNLYRCSDFLTLSLRAREQKVLDWRLCANCLRADHRADQCSNGSCRTCKQRHNSVLCPARAEKPKVASLVVVPSTSAGQESESE